MKHEIRFHPAARAEAVDAAVYLESERSGYGAKFDIALGDLCDLIVRHPKIGTPLDVDPGFGELRAFHLAAFRYWLIVAVVDDEPMVFAVAHQSREPGYWRDRLRR